MDPARGSYEQETGSLEKSPYTLRPLVTDVSLSAEGDRTDIRITCVEALNENLYIGTSAGEILHFVQIPPDPSDPTSQPSYITASRQQPPVNNETPNGDGIQQILLLPTVNKTCIISNGTLSFYSLPELSPAFQRPRPLNCVWVGGVDQNLVKNDEPPADGVIIMLCLKTRIQLVRIADNLPNPIKIKDIELGACLAASRRGDFACVSDAASYSLLDVVNQQRIPLFPISTVEENNPPADKSPRLDQWPARTVSRSSSTAGSSRPGTGSSHGRSASLNVLARSSSPPERHTPEPRRPLSGIGRYGFDAPQSISRTQSPKPSASPERSLQVPPSFGERRPSFDKALPAPPEIEKEPQSSPPSSKQKHALHPHIVSPTAQEFLLTTGTSLTDRGVGMFVNLDGDVVRGTIEFSTYPIALAVDGTGIDLTASTTGSLSETQEEGHVLAIVQRPRDTLVELGIEIQRWDLDPSEAASLARRTFIPISTISGIDDTAEVPKHDIGLRTVYSTTELNLKEVGECLALKFLALDGGSEINTSKIAERESEELQFSNRLGSCLAHMVVYHGRTVQWLVRNPFVLQLDARLEDSLRGFRHESTIEPPISSLVEMAINDLRGLDARTELEFVGFAYIKQKAAFILFVNMLFESMHQTVDEHTMQATGEALLDCDLDPRVIVSFIPLIRKDIRVNDKGIWIHGGIKSLVENALDQLGPKGPKRDDTWPPRNEPPGLVDVLHVVKSYLTHWRRKKGFGSVADGEEIFSTVDVALLHILLILDAASPVGPATAGSTRAELNAVVDGGIESFDGAVDLLESHKRLYVLSRLHQSRKQSSLVLQTWKRIIEGEEDAGGELLEGETEVRRYLSKLNNRKLVEEYGTWLAQRNPKLGVQVFADDHARVNFTPGEALKLLRDRAPDAVKDYLEYLVFGKKQSHHANELISYYLTMVLEELAASEQSRKILLQTYETYRALTLPKPTYKDFITDNAVPAEWWSSRLRLLQLLGGGIQVASLQASSEQPTASGYDTDIILQRLQPYEKELVPEMIILYGQQHRHDEAVRLLVHGLGDFDTAIRYCLLGGSSLFGSVSGEVTYPSKEEQSRLFDHLLYEFLAIETLPERVERTGELLERFGAWFEVEDVLSRIPDSWNVNIIAGFIVSHLRRIVHEKAETTVVRALSSAVNLKTSTDLVNTMEVHGPGFEAVD